ncbi:EamA family transporter [Streptomyces tsukubensis]|uniref:EamA domain-containing protein n=1 Tax=Streptomyces tsukubensis TaxID=83656 RepID=A0A1V4A3C7_9ACTN|nr:EamA family transporter [Streptomyces tsukubensis]OON73984.1 hypothetical protein B1H18_26035 [Streptomyces tsukubensis]
MRTSRTRSEAGTDPGQTGPTPGGPVPGGAVQDGIPVRRPLAPAALVLGQIVSLQVGSAVAKQSYGEIGPTAMAGMRLGFAALVMYALVRPRLRGLSAPQWRAACGLGAVLAAMNVAYFQAIARLPLGIAATVELLGPLLLALALSRRPAHLAAAGLALVGVLLLAAPGGSLPLTGMVCAAAAALGRALYILLNRRVGLLYDNWAGLSVALLTGACLLTPVAAFSGAAATVAARPALLWSGLLVAVCSSLIPYSLDMLALRRIGARSFGVLLSLSPAVGAAVGFAFLGEHLTARQGVALGLVLAGALWSARVPGRARGGPAPTEGAEKSP